MRTLREAWGIGIRLPLPSGLMEIGAVFMRRDTELILKSHRVVPRRLLSAGFQFVYPKSPSAVRDLVARWRQNNTS
jgi:NAD dependent epimerase/dehydratase family enzyme